MDTFYQTNKLCNSHMSEVHTQYKTYNFKKGRPGNLYPFVFNDTLGLEMDKYRGVDPEDIKLAMKGHMRDGYTFSPGSKLSEDSQYYKAEPTLNDKVHVLVLVVTANQAALLSKHNVKKIKDIRRAASELGIPQLAVITNIDLACPQIHKDLKNVYKSKHLKEMMEGFSQLVGIPMNYIFPVKNYHEEIDVNNEVDSLILSVLKQIIDFGEEFINHMET
ncbi:interferon-induced protein 44-like [Myripristis murdjan]|uniref:interferon-induced protein 44-like n=1 Tax=Myripristis murdjan TaxID=586833 RepID=UPI001176164B|nr:interferon-induced protein 44-like [Myripristis murdjan]